MTLLQNAKTTHLALPPRSHSQARRRLKPRTISVALTAPLVAFITAVFVVPIAIVLFYAVNNPEIRNALPLTVAELQGWSGADMPPASAPSALAGDLRVESAGDKIAEAGRRLNYEISGYRSLLLKTARALRALPPGGHETIETLATIDPRWGQPEYWAAIKRASSPFTFRYLLAALDLRWDAKGGLQVAADGERVFLAALGRTLWISFVVTSTCLLIGYPIANAIAALPSRFSAILLCCVLLPFWTSLLVRTSAWIVILQKAGIINTALMRAGFISNPLDLMFNRTGLYITMVHILLPFMVLPLLSVMKGIPQTYLKASASLGAPPLTGFLKVYLPLTMPGIGAGCLLTFIVASGYYITPTLVGGPADQMLSYFIAFYANTTINWGMSSALALILLLCIMVLYAAVGRVIGIDRVAGIG
jgi:putative spermidine/putrescine transport system permease protein